MAKLRLYINKCNFYLIFVFAIIFILGGIAFTVNHPLSGHQSHSEWFIYCLPLLASITSITSIVELNNNFLLNLIALFSLLIIYLNLYSNFNLNFAILIAKRKREDDISQTYPNKRQKLENNGENSTQQQEEVAVDENEATETWYTNNDINDTEQLNILQILQENYFNENLPPITEHNLHPFALNIADLAHSYEIHGGYIRDLNLRDNIPNQELVELLREILGDIVDGESSDNGSQSGSGDSSTGSISNSNPGSPNPNGDTNFSIMENLSGWILLLLNEFLQLICEFINQFTNYF